MNRKTMFISVIFIFVIVGSYLFIYPQFQMQSNQSKKVNLHSHLLIPLYSNHPKESWLLAMNMNDNSIESLRIKTSGMRDIVIDSNNQYAWIATYGVEFGVENDYVVAVSLDDGTIHKVKIDGEGPQVIKEENNQIYVITHDTGFSGHVVKIDPEKLEMSDSQELAGFLDAFTISDGSIYVSSFFAGIADDDYNDDSDENPIDRTIITRLSMDSLLIEEQKEHSVLLNSNDLIKINDFLYSTDDSNDDATDHGETVTKIDPDTLDIVDRIDIESGTNNMVNIPDTDKILIIRNNGGVLYEDFDPPYAFIFDTRTSEMESLDNVPLLSAAQFDKEDKNIFWGTTYDGRIIRYSINKNELMNVIDLNVTTFEEDEKDNVHVNSFEVSK